VPAGLAMGASKPWPDAAKDNATEGYLAIGRAGEENTAYLSVPTAVELPPTDLNVEGVVGGRALLVAGGQALLPYDATDPTEPYRFAPRTAVGLDGLKQTLFLLAVDGDQPQSVGMTAEEAAEFLVSVGVNDAIELNGGGSSTLYIRGENGVVNSPSDGV